MGERVIDVVRSLYAGLDAITPDAWRSRTLDELTRLLDRGFGSVIYEYDAHGPPSRWSLARPQGRGVDDRFLDDMLAAFHAAPDPFRVESFNRLAGTFSERIGRLYAQQPALAEQVLQRGPAADMLGLTATDADGHGIAFATNLGKRQHLAPAQRTRLSQLAAHLAAAHRLVRGLGGVSAALTFRPDGALADCETPEDERRVPVLRRAVLALEKGRRQGADADEALEAWRALFEGRYSLLDRFESDGKRFVIAVRNAPRVLDPRGLTELEMSVATWVSFGHSNKEIAYELGATPNAVGNVLSRVFHKLGVATRTGLIDALHAPEQVLELALPGATTATVFVSPGSQPVFAPECTPAEREVAEHIVRGARNADIARARGTSVKTVANQVASLCAKHAVRTRAELASLLRGGR